MLGNPISSCLQNQIFKSHSSCLSPKLPASGAQGGREKGSCPAGGRWGDGSEQNTAWAVDPTRELVSKEPSAEGKDGKPRAQRGREEETGGGAGWQSGE